MALTVHKIFIHNSAIISHATITLGQLFEESKKLGIDISDKTGQIFSGNFHALIVMEMLYIDFF